MQTNFAFIGLILGSIPVLFKTAHNSKGFKLNYIFFLILSFGFAISLILLENKISYDSIHSIKNYSFSFLIIAGFLMSIGVVIPGVSSSVILMILGVYSLYINAISCVYIPVLFPMGIGLILGGFLFLKIIQILLNKFFSQTYYCIIGFVLGSVLILYPGISFSLDGIISILCFIICFYIAYYFENK